LSESTNYDVIFIGTGAGGRIRARKQAEDAKIILVIQKEDFLPGEKENRDTEELFLRSRYKAKESWLDKRGKKFKPGIHYCVGGNTKMYCAALLRLREEDFGEVNHHGGVSPAWPLTYDDFESWYLKAEEMYNVHGERQSDPTEPTEDNPYPMPPIPHEPRIKELFDDIKRLGLNPFPLPIGVNLNGEKGLGPFVLDRFCGFTDPAESKADSHVIGIITAGSTENFGTEQEYMNQVYVASLDITAMAAQKGFDAAILGYITPPGGRHYPESSNVFDLWY
jgi:choline dehydrogenase-like flavoprotein